MKVYVAGPMRGKPFFNFPAFDAAASRLRAAGWTVFNPAEHDRESGFEPDERGADLGDFDLGAAFRWDVERILESDSLHMLPGWRSSEGALLEYSIARMIGTQVVGASE